MPDEACDGWNIAFKYWVTVGVLDHPKTKKNLYKQPLIVATEGWLNVLFQGPAIRRFQGTNIRSDNWMWWSAEKQILTQEYILVLQILVDTISVLHTDGSLLHYK